MKFEKFGKYTLLKRLAVGGMAEIFLAKKQGIAGVAQFVVVKRILPQYSSNKNFLEMFKNEGRVTSHLKHSNLVYIQDFGEYKGSYFIEMEYISGCTLKELLKIVKKHYRQFPIEYAVYIVRSVASALSYIHDSVNQETGKKLNAIHRDISPHNIMVSYSGDVKVIDFGIAKVDDSNLTASGVIKGKFSYMSPEQIRGKKIDCRSDIFSLGTVFWELVCGQKLFRGSNMQSILAKIRECKIPPVSRFRTDASFIEKILRKTLNKNIKERYSQASDITRHLNQFLNEKHFSSVDFQVFIKDLCGDSITKERDNLVYFSNQIKKLEKEKEITIKAVPQPFSEEQKVSYMTSFQEEHTNSQLTEGHETLKKASSRDVQKTKKISKISQIKKKGKNLGKAPLEKSKSFDDTHIPSDKNSIHGSETEMGGQISETIGVRDKSLSYYESSKDELSFKSLQGEVKKDRKIHFLRSFLGVVSVFSLLLIAFFFKDKALQIVELFEPLEEIQSEKSFENKDILVESKDSQLRRHLASKKTFVKIFIQTIPSGGNVFLNNEKIPGKTPLSLSLSKNLENTIVIQKKGYKIYRVEGPLKEGSHLEVKLTREKQDFDF